jgi:hypothetical protein
MFTKVFVGVIVFMGIILGLIGKQDTRISKIADQDAISTGDQDGYGFNNGEFDSYQALNIIAALHTLHYPY